MDKEASQQTLKNNLIFYAPSIHTGGGLILLKAVLNSKDFTNNWKHIYLDERVKTKLDLSHAIKNIIFIKSRLLAEWELKKNCKINDIVLCFHGLPPLFPIKGKVIVFLQNRILLEPLKNNKYSILTSLKKIWLHLGSRYNNIKYIVQTPSMLRVAKECLSQDIDIAVLAFIPQNNQVKKKNSDFKKFDFIYPASGESHKNHINLLKAWSMLADIGIKPSLALTVNVELYPEAAKKLENSIQEYKLNVINLGEIPSNEVLDLYTRVSALIYPSKSESLGLPLIEATEYKIPIIASELDYVRDVANPKETFDPNSPTSIARAVRRFLNNNESLIAVNSVEEFLKAAIN